MNALRKKFSVDVDFPKKGDGQSHLTIRGPRREEAKQRMREILRQASDDRAQRVKAAEQRRLQQDTERKRKQEKYKQHKEADKKEAATEQSDRQKKLKEYEEKKRKARDEFKVADGTPPSHPLKGGMGEGGEFSQVPDKPA